MLKVERRVSEMGPGTCYKREKVKKGVRGEGSAGSKEVGVSSKVE